MREYFRDALRLLFLLVEGSEAISQPHPAGAARIFRSEARLHALDFWVRYPGYLAAELLDRFELDPTKKARAYSKGNRQKVALVAALASDVELLLLDEPTSGLDPLMEEVFRQVILADQRDNGRTVLLSSHILAEVEALCDRVTIIRDGQAVETGTLAEMRHLTRTSIQAQLTRPATGLAGLPGVHDLRSHNGHVSFDVDTAELSTVLRQLTEAGVRSLVSQPPTLEELFLRHYGNATAPAAEKTAPDETAQEKVSQ